MDSSAVERGVEEPTSWADLCNINVVPSDLFVKFRKEILGIRVGVNLEFYNAPVNDFHGKLVLKPLAPDRRWKFIYEPLYQDVRLLSKKISVTKFLNLQVGIGHNFQMNATGWKWKLTTCLGGDGISRIRNKTTLGLCPSIDFRFGWRADYVLPEITGGLGSEEPLFNMNSGKFQASLDRVEAIFTYPDAPFLHIQMHRTILWANKQCLFVTSSPQSTIRLGSILRKEFKGLMASARASVACGMPSRVCQGPRESNSYQRHSGQSVLVPQEYSVRILFCNLGSSFHFQFS